MNYTIAPEFTPIIDAIETHLVGKRETIALSLATFFAGGHLLLEDIPGVGKTTLGSALSASVLCESKSGDACGVCRSCLKMSHDNPCDPFFPNPISLYCLISPCL